MQMFINDTVGMITTDDFATTRVNTPIILIKNKEPIHMRFLVYLAKADFFGEPK